MLRAVATVSANHPRRIVALLFVVLAVGGIVGGPTSGLLRAVNSFEDPSSQSARAERAVEQATGAEATPGILVVVKAPPSSPAVSRIARILSRVPGVAGVRAPSADAHSSALVSRDRRTTLMTVTLRASVYPNAVVSAIETRLGHRRDLQLGGADVAAQEITSQASHDLAVSELIAFPLLAALAILIFRGLAALIPVAVGATSVLWAFVLIRIANHWLSMSSFSLNLVIGLGLGLSIDYSLLLVWRFREELTAGADPIAAAHRTLRTAGRTIVFSATTVAAAMASLLLFPLRFLVSMGVGGIAVTLVAAAAALLVAPALLVLLAAHIGRAHTAPAGTGGWYRLAHRVMRRPATVATLTAAALLAVAAPALGTRWSGTDASVLPASSSARAVTDTITRAFPSQDQGTLLIAAQAPATSRRQLASFAAQIRTVPGVRSVDSPVYLGDRLWRLDAGVAGDPIYSAAQRTLVRVRALRAPFPVLVGGPAADFKDQQSAIAGAVPLALCFLVGLTLIVLWVMTASVVLPIKALAMNALTAAASTGLLVFVFQDGRLTGLLDYASQGGIEETDFLILAALVFALSTDYGVLLLTRIKEAHDNGAENREAVALGLERTGRLVTASAVLLAVAIGAFGTSKVIFLKEIGFGAAVAVIVDAFMVRTALVPALMALLGPRNWWQPAFLRRLHARLTFVESSVSPAVSQDRSDTRS